MTDAPERIYLDGDVKAGDGMFPRCFESPKYASEPQVEYVRADLATHATMRCAECDCENGGADCNWIATPTPLEDPRVKALVEAATELEKQAKKAVNLGAVTGPHWTHLGLARMKMATALSALEKNK